jgi:hypothetical protein
MQQLKVNLNMSQHCITYNIADDPINGHCVVPMSNNGQIFDTVGIDEVPEENFSSNEPHATHGPWMTTEWVNELGASALGPPIPEPELEEGMAKHKIPEAFYFLDSLFPRKTLRHLG